MSIFLKTNHLFLRNPEGGVENIVAMREAGFEVIFCNVGDHESNEWGIIRTKAASAGVVCGPWLRTADQNHNFSNLRLDRLIRIADEWGAPFIVNSEKELQGSGNKLTTLIAEKVGERDAAISMESWPFNDIDWTPFANLPVLPQIFPVESNAAKFPDDCIDQWHIRGVNCVIPTFGSYGGQKPSDFKLLAPYGVYTADDCGGIYEAWSSQGIRNPCARPSKPEDTVEKIGSQSGVWALAKKWRKEWPDLAGKPDPNDHTTWGAIDKWERAMLILIRDHDKTEN
jgi:hypothetical protein